MTALAGPGSRTAHHFRRLSRPVGLTASLLGVAFLVLGGLSGYVAAAGTQTVTITDLSSDVKKGTPAWQDVVSVSVSGDGSHNFTFTMTMNATVPVSPPLPKDFVEIGWWFALTVNSPFSARGWPASNGTQPSNGIGNYAQYFIVLYWDGSNFASIVANRTPEVQRLPPTITLVPYTLLGPTLTWSISPTLFESPSSFVWAAASEELGSEHLIIHSPTNVMLGSGNEGFTVVDAEGINGGALTHWP